MDFNDTKLELGAGIRAWRKRRNLTQEALAAAAKIHVNALGRVERGEANPTLKVLWKIATKLKLSVAQLILGPARE
ncbi:MAG TPA: helix-turn-helix transcriptional regulator [Steroidobacteraceae bacterium]|nr:helix-turn-helix transcriptional regulator [Steroidobacteraceae bacterium]